MKSNKWFKEGLSIMHVQRIVPWMVTFVILLNGCGELVPDSVRQKKQNDVRKKVVATALQLEPSAVCDAIYALLDETYFLEFGIPSTLGEVDALHHLSKKARVDKDVTVDDLNAFMLEAEKRNEKRDRMLEERKAKGLTNSSPRVSLAKAEKTYGALKPDLSVYEVRRDIIGAFHRAWPGASSFVFKPLTTLTFPGELPKPPPIDQKYRHFFDIEKWYWSDPKYKELISLEAEEMPDGAMIPLLYLTRMSAQSLTRDGYYQETAKHQLKKYGERLYPALVAYLVHPSSYDISFDVAPYHLLEYAKEWSEDLQKELFKAAKLSGWEEVDRIFGKKTWMDGVDATFADSPYRAR